MARLPGRGRRHLGDAVHLGHHRQAQGVCQTHTAFISAARGGTEFDRLTDREDILSYLPMAWVGDHLFSFAQAMVAGFTINCPESGETVMTDLREIGPTYYFAPPRVFENLLTQVMIRMEDASWIKRTIFHKYLEVARRCGARTSSTASRSRPATACSTGSAACWCTARSRTCSA